MSDDKDIRDGRDRSKIDLNDPSELAYVRQQYPWFSLDEIKKVIREHGPSRRSVVDYLDLKSGSRRFQDA